ncbi:hypothetical protein [Methylobacterium oryzae]|uniref:DUF4102 domain-containing protein n=1 Tax=Methylobacterium oryzae TaxID=334852 RepID=A0ABU7TKR1_9HYPH
MTDIAHDTFQAGYGLAPTTHRDDGGVTDIAPRGWPFRVLKRPGERDYAVRFRVGHLAYEGTTGCPEADLALMVAKVIHAEMLRMLAGVGSPTPHDHATTSRPAPLRPAA